MCGKFNEEVTNPSTQVNLINDNFGIAFELFVFASNIKKELCGVLESFFYFERNYEEKKIHNMFFDVRP
jgi:hypothetical protein